MRVREQRGQEAPAAPGEGHMAQHCPPQAATHFISDISPVTCSAPPPRPMLQQAQSRPEVGCWELNMMGCGKGQTKAQASKKGEGGSASPHQRFAGSIRKGLSHAPPSPHAPGAPVGEGGCLDPKPQVPVGKLNEVRCLVKAGTCDPPASASHVEGPQACA